MTELPGVIGFGALALVILYFAKRGNYFSFRNGEMKWDFPIRWYQVALMFGIYFAGVVVLAPLILSLLRSLLSSSPQIGMAVWLNFLDSFLILALMAIYCSILPRNITWKIWRRNEQPSFLQDIGIAFLSFVVAFPVVIFCN